MGKKLEYLDNAIIEYISNSDNITFPTPGQFGPQFETTVNVMGEAPKLQYFEALV